MNLDFALSACLLFAAPALAGPLHDAVRAGDAEEVDRQLASGEDPS